MRVGPDQRITSGPAAIAAASRRGEPPREKTGRNTWLHPNASQIGQILLAPRAGSIHGPSRHFAALRNLVAFGAKRTLVDRPPQRIYEFAPFCNGPDEVKSRVIVTPPSSRFLLLDRSRYAWFVG